MTFKNIRAVISNPKVSVSYEDNESGINIGSIGDGDVRLIGPGVDVLGTFEKITSFSSGNPPRRVIAEYRFQGVTFAEVNNGQFTIQLEPNQVGNGADLRAQSATVVGSFVCQIIPDEIPDIEAISQRAITPNSLAYNNNLLCIADWDAVDMSAFGQAMIATAANGRIRIPGGDPSNYWDQPLGGLIQDSLDILPFSPGNYFFPQPPITPDWRTLPISFAYRTQQLTNTVANIKRIVDSCGNPKVTWVVNGVTKTPAHQVAVVQSLLDAGIDVDIIEFFNEIYFNIPTYTGNDEFPNIGFRTSEAHAIALRDDWFPAFHAAFPNMKLLATAKNKYLPFNPLDTRDREGSWCPQLNDKGIHNLPGFAGYTVHPYYNISDIGAVKSAVGSATQAETIAKNAYEKINEKITEPSLSVFPDDTPLYITETTIVGEDAPAIVLGQTWLFALIIFQNHASLYKQKNVVQIYQHVACGNDYWEAFSNEIGGTVDTARLGQEDKPRTDYPALTPQRLGQAQKIWADVFNPGGVGSLLIDQPGFIAWRVTNTSESHDKIAVANIQNKAQVMGVPTDRDNWSLSLYSAPPWSGQILPTQFPTAQIANNLGASITLPPFSLAILTGGGEFIDPVDTQAPIARIIKITHPDFTPETNTGPVGAMGAAVEEDVYTPTVDTSGGGSSGGTGGEANQNPSGVMTSPVTEDVYTPQRA